MTSTERASALDRWYRIHGQAVRRYAIRRVGTQLAEEIVSDVFAAALSTSSPVPDEDGALPWLYAIARNTVAKARYRQARQMALDARLRASAHDGFEPDVAGPIVSREWVRSAFDRLDGNAAELLRLIVWEGLDTPAAASVLGISPGTARVRLHRLRRKVQRWLPPEATEQLSKGGKHYEHRR